MRGRKLKPIEGLMQHDFAKLACTKGTSRERRRYLAFAHLQDGRRPSEVAKMVKVFPQTITSWINKFRKFGLNGLKEQLGRGAKPYISQEEYEEFRELIEKLQKTRDGGRIRGQDIQHVMEKKCGKRPSKSTTYKTLKRAGLVWITGRSQHPKANPEAQKAFKKTLKTKS